MKTLSSKVRTVALGMTLALSSLATGAYTTAANAQVPPVVVGESARPAPVPARSEAAIARYLVGPMGHVRGFVLANNAIVMLRGPGGDELATRAPVGTPVRVEGFAMPNNTEVILHATVTDTAGNVLFAAPSRDQMREQMHERREMRGGDPAEHAERRAERRARFEALPVINTTGVVQAVLGGPRRTHAILLTDGTMIYLHGMDGLAERGVRVGETVRASGRGGSYPQGTALVAAQLTFADGATFNAMARGPAVR